MFAADPRAWCMGREVRPSDRRKWVKVFEACDEDKKGYLSREDFKVAVVMLFGYKPTKIEADSVMTSVNSNTSGICLEEFIKLMEKKKAAQLYQNEIRQIFTAFDRQYRGFLTLEDFKKAFKQVAPKLPERIVLEAFSSWKDSFLNKTQVGHLGASQDFSSHSSRSKKTGYITTPANHSWTDRNVLQVMIRQRVGTLHV
ncbi:EF-hand calcium-binding domain-containing protein 11 isoform X1 [Petaurus breviceps papuanus]|uniref:EF-hand calcium-binding domain-containing protein 11 isoform X1 n=1 Tax=Petaurus breviceps papuanus TaxID=3040969 RepID=UPI0036DB1B98